MACLLYEKILERCFITRAFIDTITYPEHFLLFRLDLLGVTISINKFLNFMLCITKQNFYNNLQISLSISVGSNPARRHISKRSVQSAVHE